MARFPFPIPNGWFALARSDEVGPGAVLPVRYFGRDLVVFRTESGRPAVLDAYCAHMGAHLGIGSGSPGSREPGPGTVVGEVTAQAAEQTGLRPGTPVVAGGADTQLGLLGAGVQAGEFTALMAFIRSLPPVAGNDLLARLRAGSKRRRGL